MRLATWNVNSVKARLPRLLNWLAEAKPDIVGLQETKCAAALFPAAEVGELGYEVAAHGDGRWNGVALLSAVGLGNVFAREGLGPWLIDPEKIAQWDVLIVAKLDRLTRSLKDFDELVEWMDKNGKVLVSASESLDLSTSTGRMFANLLAMFAQFERERIGERRREAGVKMRENGWWQGGRKYSEVL